MNIINARTPFSIVIDEVNQIETKIELFLWNYPNLIPSLPTYTFSSIVPSIYNRKAIYNISNEIKEFINPIAPNYVPDYGLDNYEMWCNVSVKRYKKLGGGSFTLLDTTDYIAVNGYNSEAQGINYLEVLDGEYILSEPLNLTNVPLSFYGIKLPFIDILIDQNAGYTYLVRYFNTDFDTTSQLTLNQISPNVQMFRIYLYDFGYPTDKKYKVTITRQSESSQPFIIYTKEINLLCETKYRPMQLSFIGKLGGWEHIYCLKANEQALESRNLDFNTNQSFDNFNPAKGQKQVFNKNGNRSIKINTGFIEEENNILVEQLFMSEKVLLDGLPVILKAKNEIFKTSLKDKNINYSFDFDYNYNIINDVV